MKHLFIVNPVAGGRDRSSEVHKTVSEIFSRRSGEIEVYTTSAPMDAAEKIRRDAGECDELRVYACGGDGTLNECVCGAYGLENVAVTSFPGGTGNDFVRLFGCEAPLFSNAERLVDGEVRKLDLMLCNGRPCLNICSVGIDARIGTDVHKYSSLPLCSGELGYIASLVINLAKGIKTPMRISCEGQDISGQMSLVCICNGNHYGGGFNPVREARPDDGELDILVVSGVSRLKFLALVGKYAKGRYGEFPREIKHLRSRHIRIESGKSFVINIDGEAETSDSLSVDLIPGGINFICPVNMDYFKNSQLKTGV